jgi:hypothetical protein
MLADAGQSYRETPRCPAVGSQSNGMYRHPVRFARLRDDVTPGQVESAVMVTGAGRPLLQTLAAVEQQQEDGRSSEAD